MKRLWDRELEILKLDVEQLAKQASRFPDMKLLEVVDREAGRVQGLLGEIAMNQDRSLHLVRKPNKLMSKATSAMIYWVRQFSLKLKLLTDEFMALQNRKMWLRLLQARFSDAAGEEVVTLEAKHLVDLVYRRQQLAKIEEGFQRDLEFAEQRRASLRLQYEAIGTADQNWAAARTMNARLGVDVADASDNPSARALKDLMKLASIPLRHPDMNRKLTKINEDLAWQSDKMAEQCAQIAHLYVKDGRNAVNINSLNNFKNCIDRVSDLNEEAGRTINSLLKEQIPAARPKIVQFLTKQDKTIA